MSVVDGAGFAAAGRVLATFRMRSMRALRWWRSQSMRHSSRMPISLVLLLL
jgi:hypothetical protein